MVCGQSTLLNLGRGTKVHSPVPQLQQQGWLPSAPSPRLGPPLAGPTGSTSSTAAASRHPHEQSWSAGRRRQRLSAALAPALLTCAGLGIVQRRERRGSRRKSKLWRFAVQETEVLNAYELRKLLSSAEKRAESVVSARGMGTPEWEAEAAKLREMANDPELWSDAGKAKSVMTKLKQVEAAEAKAADFRASAEEMTTALELAAEEAEDEAQLLLEEAQEVHDRWMDKVLQMETEVLMNGTYDASSCQIVIFAGAGGDEACDWVCMLEKMYTNYGLKKGWTVKQVDATPGDTMGMKNVELSIEGEYVYGLLKGEQGTHRLVRVWNGKRQTTFAGVEVTPFLDDDSLMSVEISDNDLKFAFFRAGGKGGQNVNKVETGVRIEHVPTGIVVKCTEERSQGANKTKAMRKLKEKLLAVQEQQKADRISAIKGDAVEAQWGGQVRNYVLQPYTMVKDVRSGHERGDADRVLQGDLDSHIDAYLRCPKD